MKITKDSNKWWFIYEIVIAVFTLSVLIFGYVGLATLFRTLLIWTVVF